MRTALKEGTIIRVPGKILYQITGEPIGEGGGSIIYAAWKYLPDENMSYQKSPILYALKECFPLSQKYHFFRNNTGEIQPEAEQKERDSNPDKAMKMQSMQNTGGGQTDAGRYLAQAKQMQLAENTITGEIYHTGFRLTPVLESFQEIEISQDGGVSFQKVCNSISVMESLSEKGRSLKSYLKEKKHLPVDQAFRIIEQLLYAVREVHHAGYLHLDLQDGNIFLKGTLEDGSGMISLIDFGSSRKRMEDGLCETIADCVLYSTPGFSAPEIYSGNDGTLRLGVEADLYSIGYLMLLMLAGHRFSAGEISANKTGRYIPRFSIRKTKCPRHMIDRMQLILAKALKTCREERYQDTEEMLKDVMAFLAMLTPYQNPLSAVEYDAFICYKHNALDTAAARELRNVLERYHGGRFFGEKPIKRVFLDEGELASCADFGERIREALKKARWLIVVCSKDTKESPWVNDEIQTFLEYHDASHVLTVVTEGEPKEIFPETLLKHGMDEKNLFAADARAQNAKQVLKKIRGDVKLKIAAPILHTTFDALKQRGKLYRIKKAFAFACIGLSALTAFFGYAAVKSREIADQAVKLADEHKTALQGQALYLSEQARQSYEAHDVIGAIGQALQAYDLLAEDDLFLPELIHTLTKAMGVYTLPSDEKDLMTAEDVFSIEGKSGLGAYFLDEEGKYLFTLDDSQIYLWDTDTCQCVKTIKASWSIGRFDENLLMDRHRYLIVMSDAIACYDYEAEAYVWNYKLEQDEQITGITVSEDKTRIAMITDEKLYILDSADGRVLQTSACTNAEFAVMRSMPLAMNSDNSRIAFVRFKEEGEESCLYEIVMYDAAADRYTVVSSFQSNDPFGFTEIRFRFTDANQLFVLHGSGVNTVYGSSVYKYYSEKKMLTAGMYDADEKRMLWETQKDYMALYETIIMLEMEYRGHLAELLVYGNHCEILDRSTGELLDSYETDAPIIRAWCEEGKIALVLQNGNLLYHASEKERLEGYAYFPENMEWCCKAGTDYYIKYGDAIIKYRQGVYDAGYESCEQFPQNLSYPSQDTEVSSEDERYHFYIEENAVVMEDQKEQSRIVLETEESPMSLHWMEESEKLLVGFGDRVSLYDVHTKKLLDTEMLENKMYVLSAWQELDASTVLYVGSTYSYALDVRGEDVGILYTLKNFAAYDAEEDVFYFESEDYDMDRLYQGEYSEGKRLGKIRRYRIEEVIEMARKRTGIRQL